MSELVKIPATSIEFEPGGKRLIVRGKKGPILQIDLPMWIRTEKAAEDETSHMRLTVSAEHLGIVPPTFYLGRDARSPRKIKG